MSIEKSKSVRVITERSRLEGLLYAALISPAILFAVYGGESKAGQLPLSAFQTYNGANAAGIVPGPFALYSVSVDSLAPTQMNEGLTEVGKKAAGFDLLAPSQLQADLLTDIEPVVIGPGGKLYLTDGHHTFTALLDSIYGASNPTVYVDVIANYSNLTTAQFFATMQSQNLLLPLNDGVAETVNDATGAPIPTSLTGLTSDVYRGLEYSILKNKSSKLFTTTSNITGAVGAATPGLDKMTGFYSDFLEAAAYRDANGGRGLPYLSPGDIALATKWNLTGSSTTTLPNVSGTVTAAQLPGFILSQNIVNAGGVSDATLATGAMDGNGGFTGVTQINAGTAANPIMIGTPNVGFVMELGNDAGYSVTLDGTNTYTGGTSILAGDLIAQGDASLGAAPTETNAAFLSSLTLNAAGYPTNALSAVQADNGIVFNSLTEGNGTLTIGTTTGGTFSTSRPIAVDGEAATINVNDNIVTLNGSLVSLGANGVGLGNATGVADIDGIISETKVPEGLTISLRGSVQAMRASFKSFGAGLCLSIVLLYLILVAQFRSFIDPFIILIAVPPGLAGAIVALLLTGTTLNIMSLMGVVMLVGIAVSNSILIVQFVRHLREEEGMEVKDAVAVACRIRLRPVLMTSFATIIGLLPMALKLGAGSEAYAPLARAILGGMIVSVALTVLLVPTAYFLVYGKGPEGSQIGSLPKKWRRS